MLLSLTNKPPHMDSKQKFATAEEYMNALPDDLRSKAEALRQVISTAAKGAEEVISYNMPAYKKDGAVLVYFAAYDKHLGFYPTASPIQVFAEKLKAYKTSKGAIQLPLDKAIPATLIKAIVKYRIEENIEKQKAKKAKKK